MQKIQTRLKELWEKVKGFFKKLNKKVRILLGVALVVILAAAILLALQMNKKEYATLLTGLNAGDTSTVVKFLSDNGVTDYQIQGDSILVPKGREIQLQSALALSGNLNAGYLYPYYTDNISMTSTSAEQERAWLVSIQQRLEAIIQDFNGVQSASVTIDPGTERLYVLQDSATPASASVLITPTSREPLSDNVVKAIRNTVAHSVERMDFENVSIDDIYGNPYSDNSAIAQANQATALKLQYEQQINNNVRQQVYNDLRSIYGDDNVSVSVLCSVDVSHKIVDRTYFTQPNNSVDGGGLISKDTLFQEIIRDDTEPTGGTVGTGTNSNLPTYPDITGELNGNETYAGIQVDRDHELDTTKEQVEILEGRISDLRVVVTVNQSCENSGAMTIDALRDKVATLAGIGVTTSEAIGRVHVSIAPFAETNVPTPPGGILLANSWVLYAAIGGLALFLILLLVVILLSRRSKKRKLARQQALEEEMAAAAAAAEAAAVIAAAPPTGGADIMEVNTEKSMELRKNVRQFAQNNPEICAQMVKSWLKGEDTSA